MADDIAPPEISAMSFEDALMELERIVRQLEDGSGKLDASIAAYERGAALRKHCEAKLQEARERVDKIVLGSDGSPGIEPADMD